MKLETEKPRELCPAGDHVFELVSNELVTFENKFKQKPDDPDEVTKLVWVFQSDQKAPDGTPYEIAVFTGTKYGNDAAALTKLLNQLVPGMNTEKSKQLDTDDLLGNRYKSFVQHVTKDSGKVIAEPKYFSPVADTPAVAPPAAATEPTPSTMTTATAMETAKRRAALRVTLLAKGYTTTQANEILKQAPANGDPTLEAMEYSINAGEYDLEAEAVA